MSVDRIYAGYKRLHTNALIKNEEEKRRIWEKLFN